MGKLFFALKPGQTLSDCWNSRPVWNRGRVTSDRFLDILSHAEERLGASAGLIPMDYSPAGYLQGGDTYAVPADQFPAWLELAVNSGVLSLDDAALLDESDWLAQAAVLSFRLSGSWPSYLADDPQRFAEVLAHEARELP